LSPTDATSNPATPPLTQSGRYERLAKGEMTPWTRKRIFGSPLPRLARA
jgi:hypothetical protein